MRAFRLSPLLLLVACLRPPSTVEPISKEQPAGPTCTPDDATVRALVSCLDQGSGPDACLTGVTTNCDADEDGLDDALESALGVAYAPVFAFNAGRLGGLREAAWPSSAAHFVRHSNLTWRADGALDVILVPEPSLDTLGAQGARVDGEEIFVDDPALGSGADFWLCMTDTSAAAVVSSEEEMLKVEGGVDVVVVARPANGSLDASTHLQVSFALLFAYNPFIVVGNHEGDWEGITVFINRQTGAVDAAWFERHGTQDDQKFVDVAQDGAVDPATESPHGDRVEHGVRFWDFHGNRHHAVAYVSEGSHAMFDYPGNTSIYPPGPKDSHNGDDLKFLPWLGTLVPGWEDADARQVQVNFVHPGEVDHITLPWARYRGQWGCQDGVVGKSWPGPFGNERHPRPIHERSWGSPPTAP